MKKVALAITAFTIWCSVIAGSEHAVLVYFQYNRPTLDELFVLEEKLIEAIEQNGVGEYDGNEIAVDGSEGVLYMYGPDADDLYRVVEPILEINDFTKQANVLLRYGGPREGAKEVYVVPGT